jgi:hypothetical protein
MPGELKYTQEDIERLIAEDLSKRGKKVVPNEYGIVFSISTNEGATVKVTGVVGTRELASWSDVQKKAEDPGPVFGEVRALLDDQHRTVTDITNLVKDTLEELGLEATNLGRGHPRRKLRRSPQRRSPLRPLSSKGREASWTGVRVSNKAWRVELAGELAVVELARSVAVAVKVGRLAHLSCSDVDSVLLLDWNVGLAHGQLVREPSGHPGCVRRNCPWCQGACDGTRLRR